MRDDIDPEKPLVKLDLLNRNNWTHPNGTAISEGDRDGYHAVMRTGEKRVFMALMPNDMSYEWLDVTDQLMSGNLSVIGERWMTVPNLRSSEVGDLNSELDRRGRLTHEFEISATPQRLDDESGALSVYRGTVTIRNRKTGAERTYETGHASTWVVQFTDDLQSGAL
jgi:hypothetical protein